MQPTNPIHDDVDDDATVIQARDKYMVEEDSTWNYSIICLLAAYLLSVIFISRSISRQSAKVASEAVDCNTHADTHTLAPARAHITFLKVVTVIFLNIAHTHTHPQRRRTEVGDGEGEDEIVFADAHQHTYCVVYFSNLKHSFRNLPRSN